MKLLATLLGGLLALLSASADAQFAPGQCVSSAIATGTASAMLIDPLPCTPTSTLALVRAIGPNVSTIPTLQMSGEGALPIVRSDGAALRLSDIASGMVMMLENTGTSWRLLNPSNGTAGATLTAWPTNPTGTTSLTGVMMGLGGTCALTPISTGRVFVTFNVNMTNNNVAGSTFGRVQYGTGTAPANAAAISGTALSQNAVATASNTTSFAGTRGGIILGATPGIALWFDMAVGAIGAGTAALTNVDCSAFEF